MQSESNPAFRKRLLKALAALGIFAFLLWWVLYNLFFDKRLFHIDPEQVIAVRLSVTYYYEEFITDREGIEEMVDLLNGFTYRRMDAAYGQFAGAGRARDRDLSGERREHWIHLQPQCRAV